MTRVRAAATAALASVAAVAACVQITAAENGVQAIRFDPVPPSIIAGDVLRDSLGAPVSLRAVAFDASGQPVPSAAFRFGFLPLGRDTVTGAPALIVDSITGAVRAAELPRVAQARLSARYGARLQTLDTIAIVRRPTRLARATPEDTLVTLSYLCTDVSTELRLDAQFGTVSPSLAVRLTGDSVGSTTPVVVPSYLVRYRITAPTSIPRGTSPYGDARPALYLTTGRNDRPINFDTTSTTGQTLTALRVIPTLLPRAAAADTTRVTVEARAFVGTQTVADPVLFVVRLIRRAPLSGAACP